MMSSWCKLHEVLFIQLIYDQVTTLQILDDMASNEETEWPSKKRWDALLMCSNVENISQ